MGNRDRESLDNFLAMEHINDDVCGAGFNNRDSDTQ
jgi:hypothetical protein